MTGARNQYLVVWLIRVLVLPISILALFSCTHPNQYQEPDLPPDQVATLSVYKFESYLVLGSHDVWVLGIDGKLRGAGFEKKLTPRQHEIYAQYKRQFIIGGTDYYPATFFIDVEAGRSYRIRAGKDEDVIRIWVEDTETKKVAGMTSIVEATKGEKTKP